MTRELIIEGQHVDLADNTDVTLEYVNNILGDIGKIELSRSYTIKIPRSARNDRILGMPASPGHTSGELRRFLDCHFYRNGIDLLGDSQAYVLRTTHEHHEIALVSNTLPELQSLSQSKATLNDLPGLPTLGWVGQNGATPDYAPSTAGAFFAEYNSGLGDYTFPTVNAATHPCARLSYLLGTILRNALVPYEVSDSVQEWLDSVVLLAAPSHKPSRVMEFESGALAHTASVANVNNGASTAIMFSGFSGGWDSPTLGEYGQNAFETGGASKHRLLFSMYAPDGIGVDSSTRFRVYGINLEDGMIVADRDLLVDVFFQKSGEGWEAVADVEVSTSSWERVSVVLSNYTGEAYVQFTSLRDDGVVFAINRVHDEIQIDKDNRFPLEGNLPDISQWDFVKSCMALFGLAPVIRQGTLHLVSYSELLGTSSQAYDWTKKVDMTEDPELAYSLDGWAQSNLITFQKNADMGTDPSSPLLVEDTTLKESRDWYELPYAASDVGNAQHYKVTADGELSDVDIEPRIFRVETVTDDDSTTHAILTYPGELKGEGLRNTFYAAVQEVVRKPALLSCNVRLNELDLASLDMRRAVYLGQTGQYYAIRTIQTSESDLCKVELIQIP